MKKKPPQNKSSCRSLKKEIRRHADKKQAKILSRFFKTGKGEYGEGDKFLGIKVPPLRAIAKTHIQTGLKDLSELLKSPYHEDRLLALLTLVQKYSHEKIDGNKEKIYKFYIKHMRFINNWDLVDLSAPYIVGPFLLTHNQSILLKWAKSKTLWTRRIAMISTLHFIREGHFEMTKKLAKILINDKEDLIHKATGWLLREIGKRDRLILDNFLKKYYSSMPRTMLRYAIEKHPEAIRKAYLKGSVT